LDSFADSLLVWQLISRTCNNLPMH
jgi:hypothetical protein